jgi:4-amino-4-deoxy-L-arabinose transferase-like glycosyltransferase
MPPAFNRPTRRHLLWALALALGLFLRLWFLHHPMPLDDDTDVYSELATNLFHHGIYGLHADALIQPTLIRLPGYPLFLALIFSLFGNGNFHAVLLTQILIDLLGCYLIASFVREQASDRAATIAIFLAALCPFTAAYSTIALTECLSIFAVSLALWSTGRLFHYQATATLNRTALLFTSIAMSMAVLLRPDGILLTFAVLFAILWYAHKQQRLLFGLKLAVLCTGLALLPLIPWTARNWITFHTLQPLAPRRVNDPGERVNYGFYRWMSTWSTDIVSTGNVFWQVGTAPININDLPTRAFDSPTQRRQTAALLAEYNLTNNITPQLDDKFNALAHQRLQAHPILCHLYVPTLRVADMFLRPRTETLSLDADWWRFDRHHQESTQACLLGLLNLALILAAIVGVIRRRIPWPALPLAYILLRCLLLSTMENSEPRYTLEAFPFLLAAAALAFDRHQLPTQTP